MHALYADDETNTCTSTNNGNKSQQTSVNEANPTTCDGCDSNSEATTDIVQRLCYRRVCRDNKQFEAWQRTRSWLGYDCNSMSARCTTCSRVKSLGLHAEQGQHYESAFIDGIVKCKDAKSLLKKINKHRN